VTRQIITAEKQAHPSQSVCLLRPVALGVFRGGDHDGGHPPGTECGRPGQPGDLD
jgi:hypothetical protein